MIPSSFLLQTINKLFKPFLCFFEPLLPAELCGDVHRCVEEDLPVIGGVGVAEREAYFFNRILSRDIVIIGLVLIFEKISKDLLATQIYARLRIKYALDSRAGQVLDELPHEVMVMGAKLQLMIRGLDEEGSSSILKEERYFVQ